MFCDREIRNSVKPPVTEGGTLVDQADERDRKSVV